MNIYRDNADLLWTMEKSKVLPEVYQGDCTSVHALLDSLGELLGNEVLPQRIQNDRTGCIIREGKITRPAGIVEAYKTLANAGFCSATVSEEYGGPGLPYVVNMAMYELIARADASLMTMLGLTSGVAETLEFFGTPDIKKEVIPKLVTGEYSGAMCLTEPNAGSDLSKLKTIAKETPSGTHITGEKIFISNCDADVHVVLAQDAGTEKQSMYVVLKNQHVHVQRLDEKCGLHASATGTILYDDSPAQLLGEKGKGLSHMFRLMGLARLGVAAQALGVAQEAYTHAGDYAAQRQQFNKPIKNLPGLKPVLESMELNLVASRALIYDAAKHLDNYQKQPDDAKKHAMRRNIFLAKLFATEQGYSIVDNALQVFGGTGYMKEQGIEQLLRDSRVFRIYEGTSQIQELMFVQSFFKTGIPKLLKGYARTLPFAPQRLTRAVQHIEHTLYSTALRLGMKKNPDLIQYCSHALASIAANSYAAKILHTQAQEDKQRRDLAERFVEYALPKVHAHYEQIKYALKKKF